MYIVAVTFEIAQEHVASFRKAILTQAKNSLELEEGCHQFDVCFCLENESMCFLYEKYTDRAAFDQHIASEHFANFGATIVDWVVNKEVKYWEQAAEQS